MCVGVPRAVPRPSTLHIHVDTTSHSSYQIINVYLEAVGIYEGTMKRIIAKSERESNAYSLLNGPTPRERPQATLVLFCFHGQHPRCYLVRTQNGEHPRERLFEHTLSRSSQPHRSRVDSSLPTRTGEWQYLPEFSRHLSLVRCFHVFNRRVSLPTPSIPATLKRSPRQLTRFTYTASSHPTSLIVHERSNKAFSAGSATCGPG